MCAQNAEGDRNILALLVIFFLGCADAGTATDMLTPDGGNTDGGLQDAREVDGGMKPDAWVCLPQRIKCSPPGTYEIHLSVYNNSCGAEVVPYLSWVSTSKMPSYWCGTYYSDGWANHKLYTYLVVYCSYYMFVFPNGLSWDVKCAVFKDWTEKVCEFSYGSPPTKPFGWRTCGGR